MKMLLLASAGGAIGAGARHLVNISMDRLLGSSFPWGTFTVNIVGSFLMGLIVEFIVTRAAGSAELRTFLATGILGGFTTFSAFSLDVANLVNNKEQGLAALYVVGSVGISIMMLYVGVAFARSVFA